MVRKAASKVGVSLKLGYLLTTCILNHHRLAPQISVGIQYVLSTYLVHFWTCQYTLKLAPLFKQVLAVIHVALKLSFICGADRLAGNTFKEKKKQNIISHNSTSNYDRLKILFSQVYTKCASLRSYLLSFALLSNYKSKLQ